MAGVFGPLILVHLLVIVTVVLLPGCCWWEPLPFNTVVVSPILKYWLIPALAIGFLAAAGFTLPSTVHVAVSGVTNLGAGMSRQSG